MHKPDDDIQTAADLLINQKRRGRRKKRKGRKCSYGRKPQAGEAEVMASLRKRRKFCTTAGETATAMKKQD